MYVAYSRETVSKDVGDRRQLFIDNDIIAVVKNVTRRQHTPVKHAANPIIKRDKPWEVTTYFRSSCFNVIWDPEDDIYKCWYEDFYEYFSKGIPSRERLLYAESRDGIEWEKPLLGIHKIDGNDTNAVINPPEVMVSCPSVMLDPVEEDPSRRFKMSYLRIDRRDSRGRKSGTPGGLWLNYSGDGKDWKPADSKPLIPEWRGDVSTLTYDPIDEKYILHGRYGAGAGGSAHPNMDGWHSPVYPDPPEGVWKTRRHSYVTESSDLINWTEPTLLWDADDHDSLDDSYYCFVPWRADEMHLGLLNVLHQVDNTLDMYLHYSRDGRAWKRFPDHRPLIPRGGEGSYDQFDIEMPTQPLVVGDELWFFYGGMKVHHDWWIMPHDERPDVEEARNPDISGDGHHLCLATMRLDGYVSLDATVREGWIETKPVFSTGDHLFINGRCDADGYIKVEVMDTWNNVWDEYSGEACETFTGDAVRHQVKWSGHQTVSEVPGAVKLRFYLRNAELYSFQFA